MSKKSTMIKSFQMIVVFFFSFQLMGQGNPVVNSQDSVNAEAEPKEIQLILSKLTAIEEELDSLDTKVDSLDIKETRELQFAVGGNVNFLDDAKLNGLYYDISVFLPKPWTKSGALSRWGIEARFAQGRLDIDSDTLSTTLSRTFRLNDSLGVAQMHNRATKQESNYLNISLNPTYSLGSDENLYLVFFFEYFRKSNTREFSTFILDSDTVSVALTDPLSFTPLEDQTNEIEETFHLFNWGIGLKLFHKIGNNVIINIRPVMGIGNVQGNTNIFYHTRFEAIESKKGFKFGGEIRGYIGSPKQDRASAALRAIYNPFVNVYIAKIFGLNTLGKLLLGD